MSQTEVALMEAERNQYDVFEKDILDREEFVQTVLDIVISRSKAKDNVTFAINGAWGTGKSFVLELFEKKAESIYDPDTSDERFLILHYNCWKYDYYEEPLVALIASITDQIEEKTHLLDEKKREVFKEILKVWTKGTGKIVSEIVKNKTGVDVSAIASEGKSIFQRARQRLTDSHSYDELYTIRNMLSELQSQLKTIAPNKTILLVVDELDRCMPDYAIKVLERIHHLTEGMENAITILCYDKTKIQCFVKTVFGLEDNANYLSKFVKFELNLDNGRLQKGNKKFQDYYELFPDNALGIPDSVDEYIATLFQGIDIREQEQLIEIARLCHTMLSESQTDILTLYMELLMTIALYKCGDTSLDFTDAYKATIQDILESSVRDASCVASTKRVNDLFLQKTNECYRTGPFHERYEPHYIATSINAYTAVVLCWFWLHEKRTGNIQADIGRCQNQIIQQTINEQKVFLKKYWAMLKRINK